MSIKMFKLLSASKIVVCKNYHLCNVKFEKVNEEVISMHPLAKIKNSYYESHVFRYVMLHLHNKAF